MKKAIGISIIMLIIALLIMSTVASAVTKLDDKDIIMNIYGGIGIHFEIENRKDSDIDVKYTIVGKSLREESTVVVLSDKTVLRSIYPIGFFSEITASMSTKGRDISRNGYLIGIFVIFT